MTYAIIYALIHNIIFRLYLYFLNILYFFKYFGYNIFHRRSLYTFYHEILVVNPSIPKASLNVVIALTGVPSLYFEITNLLLIGQRAKVLVSEIRHQSPERGHLPTAILCHHYNVTIKGSMCVQVGNPPTWLPLHHFLQLSQKWNALHTQLLTNIFWLPYLSGWTEVNTDSRFNVLSPIDGRFSNYAGLRADNSFASTILC